MSNPNDPNLQQPMAPETPAAPQYTTPPAAPAAPEYNAPPVAPPAAPPAAPYTAAPQYGQAPAQKTNVMAIVSMISSIIGLFTFGILCLLGVILGHISMSQIKRTNEGGKGMAITGLIVGYIGLIGWVIALIIMVITFAVFGAALSDPNFVAELENLS